MLSTRRFPDPKGRGDAVHSQRPYQISVGPSLLLTNHYKAFDANVWIYQQAIKDCVQGRIGKGYSALYLPSA
jgi:hypothetical protein